MNEPFDPPSGRPHPFVFVHEALPSLLFRDQEKFVDYLRGPEGQRSIDHLWEQAGKLVVDQGVGDPLPVGGMTLESVEGNGWRGVMIHMPKADELGECALILMAIPNGSPKSSMWRLFKEKEVPAARLFMLRLMQIPPMKEPELKLCELSAIMGNVTTGYSCAPTTADFVREVVDRLDLED